MTGRSKDQVISSIQLIQSTFKALGLQISGDKSILCLIQRIEFREIVLDSTQARVFFPES